MSSSTVDAKMAAKCLVVINAGSSSIKFSLLAGQTSETLNSIAHGEIEGIVTAPTIACANSGSACLPTDEELMVARHTFTLTNQ